MEKLTFKICFITFYPRKKNMYLSHPAGTHRVARFFGIIHCFLVTVYYSALFRQISYILSSFPGASDAPLPSILFPFWRIIAATQKVLFFHSEKTPKNANSSPRKTYFHSTMQYQPDIRFFRAFQHKNAGDSRVIHG